MFTQVRCTFFEAHSHWAESRYFWRAFLLLGSCDRPFSSPLAFLLTQAQLHACLHKVTQAAYAVVMTAIHLCRSHCTSVLSAGTAMRSTLSSGQTSHSHSSNLCRLQAAQPCPEDTGVMLVLHIDGWMVGTMLAPDPTT